MNIQIKAITDLQDIRLVNEPFKVWGRMIPSLQHNQWDYTIEKFKRTRTESFPNENYAYEKRNIYLGAYDHDQCIGLAILKRDMFRYLYLDDLKVNSKYRKQGIGSELITACLTEAKKRKMQGVYTIAQDTNLSACLFYVKNGFKIGGFNNRDYQGTAQEHKADIYFYRDC